MCSKLFLALCPDEEAPSWLLSPELMFASFEPYGYAPGATLPSGLVSFDDASDPVAGPSGTTHDDVTMGDAEAHADGDSVGDHAESPVNSPAAANEMES